MKFYSEKTNRLYDSMEECSQAERAYDEAEEQKRQAREKELAEKKARYEIMMAAKRNLEVAKAEYEKARKNYLELSQPHTVAKINTNPSGMAHSTGEINSKGKRTAEEDISDAALDSLFQNILESILGNMEKENNE